MKHFNLRIFIFILFFYPIGFILKYFIRQKSNSICFINPKGGRFFDNNKYLYLKLRNEYNDKFCLNWLVEDKNLIPYLQKSDINVIYYFSIKGFIEFLKSGIIIVINDSSWFYGKKIFIKGKKIIQLWHGVGFKKIGKLKDENYQVIKINAKLFRMLKYILFITNKCLPTSIPHVFLATSEFYRDEVFSLAHPDVPIENFLIENYPRNDFLIKEINGIHLWTDEEAIKEIKRVKNKDFKIVLYVPTFRDMGNNPICDGAIDLEKINNHSKNYKHIWVMKFHGMPDTEFSYEVDRKYSNIIFYENEKDIYPVLKYVDVLITDYSSIYMDFLLLDRPVVFYPYDLETYRAKDRGFSHPYDKMTPGMKVSTINELIKFLEEEVWLDKYRLERNKLKDRAFSKQDFKSSERLIQIIKNMVDE